MRTIWRMAVTRRRLLEWVPSGDAKGSSRTDLAGVCRSMWVGPVTAVATVAYLAFLRPDGLGVALPLCGLWFASPAITWWMSRPQGKDLPRLSDAQIVFLRGLARKTWRYFEALVSPEDNWLPPDNYQEHPVARIGHRTSPTNMGLALLANLTAYDFGYISAGQLIGRTSDAFQTMDKLERYRGHFYNWYDTQSLKALMPMYISTVDSGNLAGHLLTLRAGLLAISDQKIVHGRLLDGLQDTLRALVDAADAMDRVRLAPIEEELELARLTPPASVEQARHHLGHLARLMADFTSGMAAATGSDLKWWADAFARQCQDSLDELTFLAPDAFETIPTLRELRGTGTALPYRQHAASRLEILEGLARQCEEFASVDYDFLYDSTRHLLAIGYNPGEHRRDPSYYDLLASEARLGSFVAIAQGKLPQESWFALGRQLTFPGTARCSSTSCRWS